MPPDNAGYYHAAYIAAIAIYSLYTITLWRRRARVREAARRLEQGEASRAAALGERLDADSRGS